MLNTLEIETTKATQISMAFAAVLTKDIYFDDHMGRPVVLFKNSIIIVDPINLIAWAPDVHFTIERHEFKAVN